MALSRALIEAAGLRKPVKISDPLLTNGPAAKGKPTKQYNQTGPKNTAPHYPGGGTSAKGNIKLIV